jgi:hypothetical protein
VLFQAKPEHAKPQFCVFILPALAIMIMPFEELIIPFANSGLLKAAVLKAAFASLPATSLPHAMTGRPC